MKIVCISDTHERHRNLKVPKGDVLIHAGDITNRGHLDALLDFNEWMGTLPHKHKLVVAGNHDISLEGNRMDLEPKFTNFTYLAHEEIVIDGVKFFGSPYSREFNSHRWVFQAYEDERGSRLWNQIPLDTNVLIAHGPAYGLLDVCPDGSHLENVGDLYLRSKLKELTNLDLFVCGHVHESYGKIETGTMTVVNASSLNFKTGKLNNPIVVEI